MAQIRNVGAGIRSKGQVDGLVYVHVKGKTYARALPIFPTDMFKTPEAKKRQALFTLIQWHIRAHAETIKHTFSRGDCWSARNRYHKVNARALAEALDSLATAYANGGKVSIGNIENAIAAYATQNPDAILIGDLEGHTRVYLKGAWPETITLVSPTSDNTIVIIEDAGVTTTITPTGSSSSANTGNGGSTGGSNNGGGSTGNGGSTGGGNTGGGGTGERVQITLKTNPPEAASLVSGGGEYEVGTRVTLRATSDAQNTFTRWNTGSTTPELEVTVPAGGATYTAYFD